MDLNIRYLEQIKIFLKHIFKALWKDYALDLRWAIPQYLSCDTHTLSSHSQWKAKLHSRPKVGVLATKRATSKHSSARPA